MSTSPQAIAWTMAAALSGAVAGLAAPVQAASTPSDPADARAPTPPLVYESPLAGVRRLSEVPLGTWRKDAPPKPALAANGHDDHAHHHHGNGHAMPAVDAGADPHAGHQGK